MTRTYSQMHRTDKYSQHSSIIWPVWLNGWVFVYELSGSGFESSCCHLNFRFRACFEQGVHWHLSNYRVWIHSKTRTWRDKNIQSKNIIFKNFSYLETTSLITFPKASAKKKNVTFFFKFCWKSNAFMSYYFIW